MEGKTTLCTRLDSDDDVSYASVVSCQPLIFFLHKEDEKLENGIEHIGELSGDAQYYNLQ